MKKYFKNSFNGIIATVLAAAASAALFSCERVRTEFPEDFINLEVHPSAQIREVPHRNDGGVICVLLAGSFNDVKEEAEKKLDEVYGLAEQGGKIQLYTFPDDFSGRISTLYTKTEDIQIDGMLLLEAPSGTHSALAHIQDFWDQELPFNIISLFPNDNSDGQESTCNIVVSTAETLSAEQKISFILKGVDYLNKLPGVLPLDNDLFAHTENICGKGNVKTYTDENTGIRAINHFVFDTETAAR